MSAERLHLALRLEGPLQSWGFESQFDERSTGLWPTKSGILGMCCAALGIDRGSARERDFLARSVDCRLLVIAIPRRRGRNGVRTDRDLQLRRITDFHTVNNTRQADGGTKGTHITRRQYLCDSEFGAVLSGDPALIREMQGDAAQPGRHGFEDPKWGLWMGRKACIPAAPVFAGVNETLEGALELLIGDAPLAAFARVEEVDDFDRVSDSLPDQPVCFAAPDGVRRFAVRRIRLVEPR